MYRNARLDFMIALTLIALGLIVALASAIDVA